MGFRPRQINIQGFPRPNSVRRRLKSVANRAIRRLGKTLLEDGPRRIRDITRGWMY